MDYVLLECIRTDVDEPNQIYSELDEQRMERRRIEFYPTGLCFAYGGEHGHEEVLSSTPFPEDLRQLEESPECKAHRISASIFQDAWFHAAESPDSFMQMFF